MVFSAIRNNNDTLLNSVFEVFKHLYKEDAMPKSSKQLELHLKVSARKENMIVVMPTGSGN